MIWMSNTSGENTYFNQRFADYSGLTEAEMMEVGWKTLIHPEDTEETLRVWQHCIVTSEPYLNEYRLRRKDGKYRHFLARAVPSRSDAGEVECWIGSATDIRDHKLAEEALRRSEKLATAGRLAASIAHEINNPLAAVTNSLYLALQDDSLTPVTKACLEIAERELERASHADLEVSQAVELGAFVTCFADEVRQVIANLISNSLDAMSPGGRLLVRVKSIRGQMQQPPVGVKIVVVDAGHGIPSGVMEQIFEPFVSTTFRLFLPDKVRQPIALP